MLVEEVTLPPGPVTGERVNKLEKKSEGEMRTGQSVTPSVIAQTQSHSQVATSLPRTLQSKD